MMTEKEFKKKIEKVTDLWQKGTVGTLAEAFAKVFNILEKDEEQTCKWTNKRPDFVRDYSAMYHTECNGKYCIEGRAKKDIINSHIFCLYCGKKIDFAGKPFGE